MTAASRILLRLAAWSAAALPEWLKRGLYRLGPVTRFLRGLLNRAAAEGVQVVEVAGGPLRGARLALDLQSEKDHWLGTYEPLVQDAIERLLQPGQVAYDVGANIGYTSLLLAEAVGPAGLVVAFEPLLVNFRRLCENLDLNAQGKWVEAVNAAVGDQGGWAQFLVHSSGAMGKLSGSAGREIQYEHEIPVKIVTIDDFVLKHDRRAPNLVKIDVEGGERAVLAGMRKVLRRYRPALLLELHGEQAARDCTEILNEAHYRMRLLEPDREIEGPGDLPWKALLQAEWTEI